MTRNVICVAALAGLGAFAASGAWAQTTANATSGDDASNFARNRNVSVRERPRPGFEASGIHVGGFDILPRATADATYDDNIYAIQNGKTSDLIAHITPEVAVRSHWSRHEIAAFGRVLINRHVNHSGEDTTDYSAGASGRLDLLRASNIYAGGVFNRLTEPRTSPDAPAAAQTPIVYYLSQANFGAVHEMNRLKLSGRVDFARYDYRNSLTISGQPLPQDQRDRNEWAESGRAEFAYSPPVSLYLAGSLNQRNYRLTPASSGFIKDSSGFSVVGGTSFDITRLIRGDVQVGYMHQSYKDRRFKSDSGLSFSAGIEWFATPLTTVAVNASRAIQEAAQADASGYTSTNVGMKVDHELLRNVLLSARGSYGHDNYRGVDRSDDRTAAGLTATYLMNSIVGLSLAYDFQKLSSSGAAKTASFNVNRITGSVTLQY